MRVHWFQHAPFEGLGLIEGWLQARGHTLTCTRLYAGEPPPATPDEFDWLIVMGGPMNIYQYRDHPWLRLEQRLIAAAVREGKRVLGICLGAQLIADALGGKVYQNAEREIGWFPVFAMPDGAASPFTLPHETLVLHWHGDTFSLPPGSIWLAASAGCAHQAFSVGHRVLALQFHVEMSSTDIARITAACADELTPGKYIQTAAEITAPGRVNTAAGLLDRLLGIMEEG
jgi:GMP synthase-like glutamine amidotransferase